jgi:hypothetical protein
MKHVNEQIEDCRSIELDNAFYTQDGTWIESLTVSARADFDPLTVADSISGVQLLDSKEIPTGPSKTSIRRLTLSAREPYPFLLGVVLRQEAIPNRIVLQRTECEVVVTVQQWEAVRGLADEIDERFGKFDLSSVNQIEYTGEPLSSGHLSEVLVTKLSDKQLEVLETAYSMGYFDVPRRATTDDVAAELDIAPSTLSERLRVAQRNLLELVYGTYEFEEDSTSASEALP